MNDSGHQEIDLNKSIDKEIYINKSTYHGLLLSEEDFYPPEDDRFLISGIDDIKGGDSFADYTEYYFKVYYEE